MTQKRLRTLRWLCANTILEMDDSDSYSSRRERDECYDALEALDYALQKRKRRHTYGYNQTPKEP